MVMQIAQDQVLVMDVTWIALKMIRKDVERDRDGHRE
jgi:hypothetical protein